MRVAKVNVFSVNDLTGKAKETAIEAGREYHNQTFDSAEMTEQLKEHAEYNHGVKVDTCQWSLSYCQGDGVAFYGSLDLEVLAAKHPNIAKIVKKAKDKDNTFSVKIEGKNSRYHHWNSMTVEVEGDNGHRYSEYYRGRSERTLAKLDTEMEAAATELHTLIADVLRAASRDTEAWGYKVIEVDNEDEQIIELLEANEWEFDENGRVFEHPEAE